MRFYLDYNSTSPLATSVKDWLKKDNLPFANASSIHQEGKRSRKYIDEATSYLNDLFNASHFNLFYHSGASEGINTIIKGWSLKQDKAHVFCSEVDHASVLNCGDFLKKFDITFHTFKVNSKGQFDKESLIQKIKSCDGSVLLNYTWVNNVTGVVWDLSLAQEIKEETGAIIHVDSVQVPGKIKDWQKINPHLDFYTYSGHKFGALKGIGLTFFKEEFIPLIHGGGQQGRIRSGTENVLGVYSLKLALEELLQKQNTENLFQSKDYLEKEIKKYLENKGQIVAENGLRNDNTILFLQDLEAPEIVQMAFDLEGLELGTGSACSSGIQVPDRILLAHGYGQEDALKGFRLSLGPYTTMEQVERIWQKMKSVLDRFR